MGGDACAEAAEVGVVERRLNIFVERWVEGRLGRCRDMWRKGREDWCIPGHAKAIHIEEAVAGGNLSLGCGLCVHGGIVGEEFREIVLVDLFGQGMSRCWRG
jgi:hypothetical protein